MKFLSKRHSPEDDDIGRRRPIRTEQGQSRVFSYYANRSVNDMNLGRSSQEEVPKRRSSAYERFVRRVPLIVASFIIIAVAILQLFLSATPKVVVLASSSTSTLFMHDASTYQDAAAQLFGKSLSNRNKLTVDASGISLALVAKFPELSDVSVALPVLGSQPIVYIQPSEPSFVLSAQGGGYVLDSTGRALANAKSVPSSSIASLAKITDQSGLQLRLGDSVLPSTSIDFMQTVLAQLRAQNVSVSQIVLPPAAFEVDMYIKGKPYFIKFNMEDPNGALQQTGTFIAVSQNLSSKGVTPSQYIDVRVDGRAYYK
jgi:hypothetical protein